MRKLPSLNAMRAFEATARHLSFTQAANELCVTVTAVSHQVRHLEAVLGLKLFERQARALALTTSGETLFPLLRDGFDRLADAFALLDDSRSADAVTVSTTRAFAERWLMPRLHAFHAAHPAVMVHIDASEEVMDLRAEGIDLAIRYGAVPADQRQNVLLEDSYIAVASSCLCPAGHSTGIADMLGRPLIGYRWKNRALEAPDWPAWLAQALPGTAPDFRQSWFSEETLALHAADRGLGPLLCSDTLVDDALRDGSLVRLDGGSLPGFAFRLVEGATPRKRSTVLFRDWLRAEATAFRRREAPVLTLPRAA